MTLLLALLLALLLFLAEVALDLRYRGKWLRLLHRLSLNNRWARSCHPEFTWRGWIDTIGCRSFFGLEIKRRFDGAGSSSESDA